MRITRVIWLHQYVAKIESKHGVYRDEILDVLASHPRIRRMAKGRREEGEHLYVAFGQTEAGRYLAIFFIRKLTGEALIISARDMDDKERRSYDRK